MKISQSHISFLSETATRSFDLQHREVIAKNVSYYEEDLAVGMEQFTNLSLARKRAGMLRHHAIEHLEDYLKTFEQNFIHNGGRVIWAETAQDALRSILDVFNQYQVKTVVKSRSLVSEEIGLNAFLQKHDIECLETDLGAFIVQLTDDRPYHMMTPAMQRTTAEVSQIFHERFGLSPDATPADITAFVRKHLRKKFLQADAGITGADFLVADTGSVALTENEGSAALAMTMPRLHVVVAGIDRVLASVYDLELFWPLLATHATGQEVTSYNSLVSGPRIRDERDGPTEMVVVLVDNGRSRLLATIPQRRALACIQCGACLSVCPVFRAIGGHTYGTTYSGPIGAVISPFLTNKFQEYKHLSFASTLCGKCTQICPVGIDLHHQLIMNRRLSVKMGYTTRAERWSMWAYKVLMRKRKRLDKLSPGKKNYLFRKFLSKGWGDRREAPMAVKSFKSRYK